ncbi:MAG: pilus assembly protein TadG-related protein [Gammaproteobacteria bacterium]
MREGASRLGNNLRELALSPRYKRQRGQAAVFVFVFMTVLVIGMSFLYKAGKLTSDKMALQNAADAAAYSVSVVEARDLNFASYMNRAIIANEVAIGQMVGLASWAFHWRSFDDYLRLYAQPLNAGTVTAPLGAALEGFGKVFRISGDVFIKVMKPLANYGTLITHNINKFYGYAQYGFHVASTVYALGTLSEMIDQNAPPGARLSEYGLLSLIGHLATYGALPGLPGEKFTRSYNPAKRSNMADFQADVAGVTDAGGYGRLAAIIQESGDPFINKRGWIFDLFRELYNWGALPDFLYHEDTYPNGDPRGWVGIDVGSNIDLGIFEVEWSFWLMFHMDLSRLGGSELRMVVPMSAGKKKKKQAAGQFFSWSSADTTNLGVGLKGGFAVKAWIVIPIVNERIKVVDVGASVKIIDDRLRVYVNLFGGGTGCAENEDGEEVCEDVEGEEGLKLVDAPFPTNAPFGAGFAQAGIKKGTGKKAVNNFLQANKKHMGRDVGSKKNNPLYGPVPMEAYGGAASKMLAWEFVYPPGIFYQAGMPQRQVNKKYGGLPRYVDTANNNPLSFSGGPSLVVGVMLGESEFDLANPAPGQPAGPENEPTGRFQITEELANDQIHVLAKSEVYFKRPTDLNYFRRGDGQEEYGSTFNPYWQARLTETSHGDRTAALKLQQGVLVDGTAPPYSLSSLFGPIIKALGL